MKPKHGGSEDDFSFPLGDFKVPCYFSEMCLNLNYINVVMS